MGVLGLWKLIEQSGKPVPLDTLENKVLAVDISIWLHQVIKGFQDSKGSALPNAHVLGLFHRLCKLMYYRIKPIFVFDGGVPILKKQTIAKRHQSKNNYQNEADRIQQLLLETLAKEKVVQQALGSATNILISPSKKAITSGGPSTSKQPDREEDPDAIFKLPPLKAPEEPIDLDRSDSSMDEKSSRHYYHLNLNAIDVTSVYFKNLPADVRHEILNDIKETRKQSSWGRLHELPVESDSFSSFQMKRLLKRRQVQVELEEAEKEMGGKCLSLAELESLLTEEGVETSSNRAAQQIASDENTRFLLVRDVQKAIEKAKAREEAEKLAPKAPKLPKLSKEDLARQMPTDEDDKEMDEELQLAIKMSLMQDENPHAVIELDDDELRMSRKQKQTLGNAAQSLARGFMLEYGGMTNEEFNELLHQTQDVDGGDINDSMSQMFAYNGDSIVKHTSVTIHEVEDEVEKIAEEIEAPEKNTSEPDTESDSDFVDVPEDNLNDSLEGISLPLNSTNHFKPHYKPIVDFTIDDLKQLSEAGPSKKKEVVEVIIKHEDIGMCGKDDIFADIFTAKQENSAEAVDAEKKGSSSQNQHTQPMISIPKLQVNDLLQEEDSSNNIKQPKVKESNVPKAFLGLKIKKVDDINAQLKEELENLKKGPSVIDLEDIAKTPILSQPDSVAPSTDLKSINETLKQQLEELKSSANAFKLDEIKLDGVVDLVGEPQACNNDEDADSDATIIYDADSSIQKTPTKQIVPDNQQKDESKTSPKVSEGATVIEILDSPAKKGTLEHLIVARTPGKDSQKSNEPEELVPHVTKPFFVNKTPPSAKQSNQESFTEKQTTPAKTVSKELFPEPEPVPSTSKQMPPPDPKPVSAENLITEMADTLKETHTPLELKRMALNLAQTERELEREKNKQSRLGVSITDQMRNDCMELLQLFGVPYIVAPMEAEAQCAFLNQIDMTDGTITDDSDIWLFGGKKVYKNFFNQQKLVLEFTIEGIEQMFHMDRKKLIQLALLVGSDYTTGIHGIGAVTALEILASFPPTPEQAGETSELMSMLSGLRKFRDWWQHGRTGASGTRMALKSKLKNIDIGDGFPSTGVVDAYLRPTVDFSEEEFTWGYPDADRLRDYARQKFGWAQTKTNDILLPVLKRLDERKSQASIKNYFKVQSAIGQSRLKVSKRVQHAVDTMAGKIDPNEGIKSKKKSATKPKQPGGRKRKQPVGKGTIETIELDSIEEDNENGDEESGKVLDGAEENNVVEATKPTKKRGSARKQATGGAGTSAKPKRGRKKALDGGIVDTTSTDGKQQSDPESSPSQRPTHSLANIGGIIANINHQSAGSMEPEVDNSLEARRKRIGNKMPDFNPAIPQRVKDEQEMVERKRRAAELFKKLKANDKQQRQ
ncbi:DNA excision repair protein ERCC-5 [Anopheles marshallii]|uniref:DNA excision repair protein ERCC-5 n=1 Tax=Anopheles marshallii TaxID=1521116 RepID=UPI00237ACEA0|nr:DNA excision repair protein ERCC-5 [Anopheles marshallii]